MPNKSINAKQFHQQAAQSKGDGLVGVGRTIVDKAVRDDGELSARWVHVPNAYAHGIQPFKGQLLGFIG